MKVTGFDELARKMRELEKAIAELDGDFAYLNFDPEDPSSIEKAIDHLNAAVDEKIASYAHNDLVIALADELKENGRNEILECAAAARLDGDEEK